MQAEQIDLSKPSFIPRLACGILAALASAAVLGFVLALFASASREPWLQRSAQTDQLVASCAPLAVAARDSCLQRGVAALRAQQPQAVVALAAHDRVD
jgi:hypothetical protein